MKPSFTDMGVVLRQTKLGEADRIVRVLSANHGLVAVVAKGVRRAKSRKAGHLDNFTLIKFHAARSRGSLQIVTQVESLSFFPKLKADLRRVHACFIIGELLNQALEEGQEDAALFVSVKNCLEALEAAKPERIDVLVGKFQLYLIKHLGYPPPANDSPETITSHLEQVLDTKLRALELMSSFANFCPVCFNLWCNLRS